MKFIDDLDALWESKERDAREYGQASTADLFARVRRDLREKWTAWETEPLTLSQASEESGIAYETLRKWVRWQRVPNAGSKGSPRILRRDLLAAGRLTTSRIEHN